jgi:hypothetical protein
MADGSDGSRIVSLQRRYEEVSIRNSRNQYEYARSTGLGDQGVMRDAVLRQLSRKACAVAASDEKAEKSGFAFVISLEHHDRPLAEAPAGPGRGGTHLWPRCASIEELGQCAFGSVAPCAKRVSNLSGDAERPVSHATVVAPAEIRPTPSTHRASCRAAAFRHRSDQGRHREAAC